MNYTEEEMEDFYEFLEDLRESGVTNMLGATPYLMEEFEELTKRDCRQILSSWLKNH